MFRSRKADRLKLICWDGSDIAMPYKRLEEHREVQSDLCVSPIAEVSRAGLGVMGLRGRESADRLPALRIEMLEPCVNALIFSHQRCGSSNLLRFVRDACKVPAGMESFNNRVLTREFPDWRDAGPKALSSHFEKTLAKARVIKHIYGQHEAGTDGLIASTKGVEATIFLFRQDAHASALSTLMARRLKDFTEVASRPIGNIPIEEVEKVAEQVREKRHRAIDLCLNSGKPVLSLPYEALFSADISIRKKRAMMVLEFLDSTTGITATDDDSKSAFSKYLGDSKKINSDDTYRQIGNFAEIKAAFPRIFA